MTLTDREKLIFFITTTMGQLLRDEIPKDTFWLWVREFREQRYPTISKDELDEIIRELSQESRHLAKIQRFADKQDKS